jgi:predicted RNA-binding Zn ribbon-like protein
LRTVFEATSVESRTARTNALLDDGVRRVQLAIHDDLPPHLHFAHADIDPAQRVMALTAGGLATFLAEAGGGRIGVCARPGCERAYVDTSKNGRRAYCSATCGNTHAVQRYRERRAAAPEVARSVP